MVPALLDFNMGFTLSSKMDLRSEHAFHLSKEDLFWAPLVQVLNTFQRTFEGQ